MKTEIEILVQMLAFREAYWLAYVQQAAVLFIQLLDVAAAATFLVLPTLDCLTLSYKL